VYADTPDAVNGVVIGSQTSYRTGTKIVSGASQLTTIRVAAFSPVSVDHSAIVPHPITQPVASTFDHTRTITLTYNSNASISDAAPYRELTSIQETARGATDDTLVT